MAIIDKSLPDVALFTRAWIEMIGLIAGDTSEEVALFTRAWIEIIGTLTTATATQSPSLRGRGLKLQDFKDAKKLFEVALFTRAWIEILVRRHILTMAKVALFTRAWIEIEW